MIINISKPDKIKTYIDKECEPYVFTITQTPSIEEEDTTVKRGFIFSLYSKDRNDVYLLDRVKQAADGVTIRKNETGEIFGIEYNGVFVPSPPDDGFINTFSFKPDKDSITRIGYTNFDIITQANFDTMKNANDGTILFLGYYQYIHMFAVAPVYSDNTTPDDYRFFVRKSISGSDFNNSFTEVDFEYFKNLRNEESDVIPNCKPTVTVVYKCRFEKRFLSAVSKNQNKECFICKEGCCGGVITDEMKVYMILQFIDMKNGLFDTMADEDYTDEEFVCAGKTFNMLESLLCGCDSCKCSKC